MSGAESNTPRGLPGPLPAGERILWQGAPDWKSLALRAFHVREVAAWFAALAVWRFASAYGDGVGAALANAAAILPVAAIGLGLLGLLAYAAARCTIYTITNRRVAMRIGVALTANLSLPFGAIRRADLKTYGGVGDITLGLDGSRIAYLTIWPHVRPWRLKTPEPMLRAIPNPEQVAALLADALAPGLAARMPQSRAAAPSNDVAQPASAALAS